MVSASKAAREAKKAALAAEGKLPKKTVASRSKAGSKNASGTTTPDQQDGDDDPLPGDDEVCISRSYSTIFGEL
jgi:ATP-binding cassette subfamily F protein 2